MREFSEVRGYNQCIISPQCSQVWAIFPGIEQENFSVLPHMRMYTCVCVSVCVCVCVRVCVCICVCIYAISSSV